MAVVVQPIDASAGAPAFTAQQSRQAFSAHLGGARAARPLGAYSGVRPGTPTTTVVLSGAGSTTWTVGAHSGVLDTQTPVAAGPYEYAADGTDTGTITAANGSNPRIDVIWVTVNDTVQDGSGLRNGTIGYSAGTAAATPAAPTAGQGTPAVPARAMILAQVNVPTAGGGSPTATWVAPYCVAAGGERPVASAATAGTGAYDGEAAWDQAAHQSIRWSAGSSAWQPVADPLAFTAWVAYTPVLGAINAGTAPTLGASTLVGRYKQVGKRVTYQIRLTIGSGYVVGSGIYSLSLPVAANATSFAAEQAVGVGSVQQTTTRKQLIATVWSSTSVIMSRCSNETLVDNTGVGLAWASGNILTLTGTYEAA